MNSKLSAWDENHTFSSEYEGIMERSKRHCHGLDSNSQYERWSESHTLPPRAKFQQTSFEDVSSGRSLSNPLDSDTFPHNAMPLATHGFWPAPPISSSCSDALCGHQPGGLAQVAAQGYHTLPGSSSDDASQSVWHGLDTRSTSNRMSSHYQSRDPVCGATCDSPIECNISNVPSPLRIPQNGVHKQQDEDNKNVLLSSSSGFFDHVLDENSHMQKASTIANGLDTTPQCSANESYNVCLGMVSGMCNGVTCYRF